MSNILANLFALLDILVYLCIVNKTIKQSAAATVHKILLHT